MADFAHIVFAYLVTFATSLFGTVILHTFLPMVPCRWLAVPQMLLSNLLMTSLLVVEIYPRVAVYTLDERHNWTHHVFPAIHVLWTRVWHRMLVVIAIHVCLPPSRIRGEMTIWWEALGIILGVWIHSVITALVYAIN